MSTSSLPFVGTSHDLHESSATSETLFQETAMLPQSTDEPLPHQVMQCVLPEVIHLPQETVTLVASDTLQDNIVWSWQFKRRMKQRRTMVQRLRRGLRLLICGFLGYSLYYAIQWFNTCPQWWVIDALGVASPQVLEAWLHPFLEKPQHNPLFANPNHLSGSLKSALSQVLPSQEGLTLQKRLTWGETLPSSLKGKAFMAWAWHISFQTSPVWLKVQFLPPAQGSTVLPTMWLTTTQKPILEAIAPPTALTHKGSSPKTTTHTETLSNAFGVNPHTMQNLPVLLWHPPLHKASKHLLKNTPTPHGVWGLMQAALPTFGTSHTSKHPPSPSSVSRLQQLKRVQAWTHTQAPILKTLYHVRQLWGKYTPLPLKYLHYYEQDHTLVLETADNMKIDLGVLDDTLDVRMARIQQLWPHWQQFKAHYHTLVLRWDEQITAISSERVQPLPKTPQTH
jgi:hypothetical protein